MPFIAPFSVSRPAGADTFSALLEELLDCHNNEVNALCFEITRLKAGLDQSPTRNSDWSTLHNDNNGRNSARKEVEADVGRNSRRDSTGPDVARMSMGDASGSLAKDKMAGPAEPAPTTPSEPVGASNSEVKRTFSLGTGGYSGKFMRGSFRSQITKNFDSAPPKSWLSRMVRSEEFNTFFASVIVMSVFVMAAETQYNGKDVAALQRFTARAPDAPFDVCSNAPSADAPRIRAADEWPGADIVFIVFDWILGLTFTAELVMKIVGLRRVFLYDFVNWMDLFIVTCWFLTVGGTDGLNFEPEIFRLFRLVKLLRLLRVFRTFKTLDALYMMTTALRGSFKTMGWSILIFVASLSAFALIMCEVLQATYFDDDTRPFVEREMVWAYFGTFTRSLFTMFELTFANYPPVARLLAESVHGTFMIFTILYKLTLGFAVVGVINAIFIQETFHVTSLDDDVMIRRKQKQAAAHRQKMERLFCAADESNDGFLDRDELRGILLEPDVKHWLSAMEFPIFGTVKDVDALFDTLDKDGSGKITMDELVSGVSHLRGHARSQDLYEVLQEVRSIRDILDPGCRASIALAPMDGSACASPSLEVMATRESGKAQA